MGDLVKGIARELGEYLLEELQRQRHGDEWIDQFRSPLCLPGQAHSRRHCALVRRRIASGLHGAYISPDGKQYFLTTAALAEECRSAPSDPATVAKTTPPQGECEDGYAGMMRVIRGGNHG